MLRRRSWFMIWYTLIAVVRVSIPRGVVGVKLSVSVGRGVDISGIGLRADINVGRVVIVGAVVAITIIIFQNPILFPIYFI